MIETLGQPVGAAVHPSAAPAIMATPELGNRELDRKVAGSLLWQTGRVAIQVLQFIVLARLVAPAEFGKLALAAPLFALLGVLGEAGLGTAAVTSRRYGARLASTLLWTQLVLGVAVVVIMAAAAPVLASVHGVPELTTIGLCLGATLLVTACGLQSKAALRRRMSIGRLALVDIGAAAAGLSAAWAASAHTTTVILLLVSQVVAAGTATILAIAFAPVRMQRPVAEPAYRNAVGVGWEILGADVLNIVRVQCPVFVLGFVVLVHDIGLFSRANQLLNLPLAVLGPALTNFLLPLLARTQGNDERFRRHVRRTTTLFLLAAIPASVWIAIGPADLVALVLGEDWRPSVPILCWLSPLFASQVVSTVALTTLMAREQSAAVRLFSFWNLALTAIAVVAATPWGITGVAVALAVSGLGIRAPLLIRLAVRAGTMHPADVLLGLRRMVALAAVTAIALGACRLAGPGGPAGDALGLAVCAAISAAGLTFVYLRSIRETTR